MKIILERNLDFRQFQNLIILTFIILMVFLGMLNSIPLQELVIVKLILFILILFFFMILFTKKGLVVEQKKLFTGVFLLEKLIFKKPISTDFKSFSLLNGKLSTNYNYSYDIEDFHKWEPDLNVSIQCYTLNLLSQDHRNRVKFLTLTNIENAKEALNFIVKNISLKYEKYSPH